MGSFRFIDLFCGIGGFHRAMSDLGGECVYACDIDAACRRVYWRNWGIVPGGDITGVAAGDIPAHDVLCAGFPCQSFSKAGRRLGFADGTRGTLFFDIVRILRHHRPGYALLENVRNLAGHDHGDTWRVIRGSLVEAGYRIPDEPVVFSPHWLGVPQHRERVFIMCVREDMAPLPPFRFDACGVPPCGIGDVLLDDGDIPDLGRYRLGPGMVGWIDSWNAFLRGVAGTGAGLPRFPVWADSLCALRDNPLYARWDGVPAWKRRIVVRNSELWEGNREFVGEWLEKARGNPLFFGAKARLEWQAGETGHPDIWRNVMQVRPSGLRVRPADCFPALVAIGQVPIVGERRRYLTPRECARLQGFPDSFVYDDDPSRAYRQFGNCVNVDVARLFARYMFGDKEVRGKYSCG